MVGIKCNFFKHFFCYPQEGIMLPSIPYFISNYFPLHPRWNYIEKKKVTGTNTMNPNRGKN